MSNQDAYRKKAEAKLAEQRAEIDKVRAKVKGAGADAEIEARKALDEAEGHFDAAKKRLSAVVDAGEEAWEDLTQGFEDAWKDVSGAVKKAIARLR